MMIANKPLKLRVDFFWLILLMICRLLFPSTAIQGDVSHERTSSETNPLINYATLDVGDSGVVTDYEQYQNLIANKNLDSTDQLSSKLFETNDFLYYFDYYDETTRFNSVDRIDYTCAVGQLCDHVDVFLSVTSCNCATTESVKHQLFLVPIAKNHVSKDATVTMDPSTDDDKYHLTQLLFVYTSNDTHTDASGLIRSESELTTLTTQLHFAVTYADNLDFQKYYYAYHITDDNYAGSQKIYSGIKDISIPNPSLLNVSLSTNYLNSQNQHHVRYRLLLVPIDKELATNIEKVTFSET